MRAIILALIAASAASVAEAQITPGATIDLRPGSVITVTLTGRETRPFTVPVGTFVLFVKATGSDTIPLVLQDYIYGATAGQPIRLVLERQSAESESHITGISGALMGTTSPSGPPTVLDLGETGKTSPVIISLTPSWPRYSGNLNGRVTLHLRNPNGLDVRVGLRSAGKGKDITIVANGDQVVRVPSGEYMIYFQEASDADAPVYQGESVTVTDGAIEIQVMRIVHGE